MPRLDSRTDKSKCVHDVFPGDGPIECLKKELGHDGRMRGQRIILDKSVVYGLTNAEVDSLDRYFFQIVPSILVNEILADLTKQSDPNIATRIAAHTYRVSGNHGLTLDYHTRLANSLLGNEIPMDGRFFPSRELVVRTAGGSLATIVETPLEDAVLARWQRGEFNEQEKLWAERFRRLMDRPLNPKPYLDNIQRVGLTFDAPQSDEELISSVDRLLNDRKLLPRLFALLARHFQIPAQSINEVIVRWYKEGRKPFDEFAPYAFFCLRANFLWHLSLTNPKLFKPDKNDRKDLEYCYYLPNTQIFATKDEKSKRLLPTLLRSDQSLVDGDELKKDLRRIKDEWSKLTKEQKIALNAQRGDAPPEDATSIIYQLWEDHDGEINPSRHKQFVDVRLIDPTLPKEQQVEFTFREFSEKKTKEIREGTRLSEKELQALNQIHKGKDPTTMRLFRRTVSKERLKGWHPELSDADLQNENSDIYTELYLDPQEYGHLIVC